MRRSPVALMPAVCLVGVIGVLVAALLRETPRGFTIGVPASSPTVTLTPGRVVCQRPITVPEGGGFNRIRLTVGTFGRPGGPRLDVTVRAASGRVLARGALPAGYPDIARQQSQLVPLDVGVGGVRALQVCIADHGSRKAALYGSGDGASRVSSAYLGRTGLAVDIAMSFERAPRSDAALASRILTRASLFRMPFAGLWLYMLLAAVLLFIVPLLLAGALRSAADRRD